MSLQQVNAPGIEPISLLEARTFIRVDSHEDDELITRLITVSRQAVEAFTARSLIQQSWLFTVNAGYGSALSDGFYLSGLQSRGVQGIELPRSPFIELTTCPQLKDDYGTRDLHDYRLDTAGRVARMHFGATASALLGGKGDIHITFSAGYGDKAEDVPEAIRQAILMGVADLYEKRTGTNDNHIIPQPLSDMAVALIRPYKVMRLL